MSQLSSQSPIVVAPQPNIYSVLLAVAAFVLAVTIGFVLYNLMSQAGYGLSFSEVFTGLRELPAQ